MDSGITSEIEYEDNLEIKEKNMELFTSVLYPEWDSFLKEYSSLSRKKFHHTLFVEFAALDYLAHKLGESQDTTSLTYNLLTIDKISIMETSIGESFQAFNLQAGERSKLYESKSISSKIPLDLTHFRRKPVPMDCDKIEKYYQSISDN